MVTLAGLRDRVVNALGFVTKEQAVELAIRARTRGATAAGVDVTMGRFTYEAAPNFRDSKKFVTLDNMENDPHVKDILDAAILPLLTGKWEVTPASDSPKDIEVAEFVAAVLLGVPSDRYGFDYYCQTSFQQRITEECDALRVGYSIIVPSYRRVGVKVVYDRLQWLEPDTLDPYLGWELDDNDNIIAINRQYMSPKMRWAQERIEAKDLRLFVWDPKGARYEGRSLLRSVYGAWFRKDFFLRQQMSLAQKIGAPVPIVYYPEAAQKDAAEELAKLLRGTSPVDAHGVFPISADGRKLEATYAGLDKATEMDRMQKPIQGENAEIGHGGKTKSRSLGETETGSRAVGESQGEDEDLFREAVARWLTHQENNGFSNIEGLVAPLVALNFAVKSLPQISVSRIGPREDKTSIKPMIEVWSSVAPLEVKRLLTERLGFALGDEFYAAMEEEKPEIGDEDEEESTTGDETDRDEDEDGEEAELQVPASVADKIKPLLVPTNAIPIVKGGRAPNGLESAIVQLAAVRGVMEAGGNDVHQDLRVIRDDMIRDLMFRLRSGKVTTRNAEGLRRSKFRGSSRATSRLVETLRRIGENGAEHVSEEIRRPGRGTRRAV